MIILPFLCSFLALSMAFVVIREVLQEHIRKEKQKAYWEGFRKGFMFPQGRPSYHEIMED